MGDIGKLVEMYRKYAHERDNSEKHTIPILKSRYTPGLKNGKGVAFQKGDVVSYKTRDGKKYKITIDSERMQHKSGYFGYEAIFFDGRYFAVEDGIYDWEGKR